MSIIANLLYVKIQSSKKIEGNLSSLLQQMHSYLVRSSALYPSQLSSSDGSPIHLRARWGS